MVITLLIAYCLGILFLMNSDILEAFAQQENPTVGQTLALVFITPFLPIVGAVQFVLAYVIPDDY